MHLLAISPSTAVTDSLPPELADDYQLAMDRKVPRLRAVLTPERLAELCAQFYASEGGSP